MFDFSNLDLSQAQLQGGRIKPGRYVCTIIKAEVKDNRAGTGKNLVVTFGTKDNQVVSTVIVLTHPNPTAVEIGRNKLYTMLVRAHHPSPRHPGSVTSMWGLKVGIILEQNGEHVDVRGYYEPDEDENENATEEVDESTAIPF